MQDIHNAFTNKYPKELHSKLKERQENAQKLVDTQKKFFVPVHPPVLENRNSVIKSAENTVEIAYNDEVGRHVVAASDLKVGDVVAVEEPYMKVLTVENNLDHCAHCFKSAYNMDLCNGCMQVMYCSQSCKSKSWSSHHYVECPILYTLISGGVHKLVLLALRICIYAKAHYEQVPLFTKKYDFEEYSSNEYEEIHNLISNTHLRKTSDLFPRAVTAAVIYELVRAHTTFFHANADVHLLETTFKELLLRHMQTGPLNFHEISELAPSDNGLFETVEVGAGAYSFLSLINHSCSPNVVRHCYDGSVIVLRVLAPIAKGEQIFDNYG